jgi:aminoglycoside N3'-acetyltransferase
MWYVLVGFNSTIEEDIDRLNFLRENNQNAYVQRYDYCRDKKYITLAKWANQPHIFRGMTLGQFKCKLREMGMRSYL